MKSAADQDIGTPKNRNKTDSETLSLKEQISILKKELVLEKEKTQIYKKQQEALEQLYTEKIAPSIDVLSNKIKTLQNDLHLKNQELSNILQSLSNGLVVTDLQGSVTSFNRSAVAITGIRDDKAVGRHINKLFDLQILPDPLDEPALEYLNEGRHQQFVYLKSDGKEIIVDITTTIMVSDRHERQGIIINMNDITVLKRLEEEAERKNRLTAAGQIAAQVAHEIRNPLGSIELFTSMMKKDLPEDSSEYELINHIASAVRSMNHIISNLLEYTKPRPVVLERTNLHSVLESFIDFSRFSAEQHQVEIESNLIAGKHQIKGNGELLKQVFHNLFVNACQAMPEGGGWLVTTENITEIEPAILRQFDEKNSGLDQKLTLIKVSFEDTGKGMSEKVKKRIFDPFFTTREKGTGLGMSIVQSTMRSHGGAIKVESSLNVGTKISLLFPVYS